jgi:hypothetical protein
MHIICDLTLIATYLPATGQEWCGVANFSQRYMGGSMQAWGWSDTRCTTQAVFICKASSAMLAPRFTSRFTNSTFQLATYPSTFSTAQMSCNQQGGHLALYQSVQEQVLPAALIAAHAAGLHCEVLVLRQPP